MSDEKERQEILKIREENQRTAERVAQGTAYHESVTVFFTDRQAHVVEVYALSGKQFLAAARKANVDPTAFGKPEKMLDNMDFIVALAEAATRDPEIADKTLGMDETATIAIKAAELIKIPKN